MKFELNTAWLAAAAFDWLMIAFAVCIAYCSPWLFPVSVLLIGNRQHALGILGHDGAHKLVCRRSKRINDCVTNLVAFYPLGMCLREYRKFHRDHHLYTNNDRDPEVLLKDTQPNPITGPVTLRKVLRHGLMDLVGFGIPHEIKFMLYIRPRTLRESVPIMALALISVALLFSPYYLIPILWLTSLATSFWFFFRLRVWSEHVGLGEGETLQFSPTLFERALFLPHNTWLHCEHHEKPAIEFNKLPALRTKQFPRLLDAIKESQVRK